MVQEKKNRIIFRGYFLCLIMICASLISCTKTQKVEEVVNYDGPLIEADNIITLYSDSSKLRIRMKAPKQLEMQNGDRVFPKGVWAEFFDKDGKKTSTLTANSGTFYKDKNRYTVKGDVVIKNLEEHKQLNTEELNWDPNTKKIDTDKFVRIETPEQILTGTGLQANQDFSFYKILKPEGIFNVNESAEDEE